MKLTNLALTAALVGTLAAPVMADTTANAQANAQASVTAQGSYDLAQARSYVDVLASLEAEGYVVDEVSTTFLGRVKIETHNTIHAREIVVSRSTGEILSDQIVEVYAQGEGSSDATVETTDTSGGISAGATVGLGLGLSTGGGSASGSGSGGVSIGLGN